MSRKIDWQRLNPRFWLQNYKTDWEWDALLNQLLDAGHVPEKRYGTVKIGEVEVWVANWPYAYGSPHRPGANVLPSVATRKRLRALVPPDDPLSEVRAAVQRAIP